MPGGMNLPFRSSWAKLSCRHLVSSLGPTQLRCSDLELRGAQNCLPGALFRLTPLGAPPELGSSCGPDPLCSEQHALPSGSC